MKKRPLAERFMEKVVYPYDGNPAQCWEWVGSRTGRGQVYGHIFVDGRKQLAHRVALMLAGEQIPDGMCVCHHCDNPGCVNPAHLFVCTHLQNSRDMVEKGRRRGCPVEMVARGEDHGRAKLTTRQVQEIRRRWAPDVAGLAEQLAQEYGVARRTVWAIGTGRVWRHIA